MKHKHFAVTALSAALAVTCVGTTVLASAATADGENQNAPVTAYTTCEQDVDAVMMMNGESGEKLYSVDGGGTWMSEEKYQAQYGSWGDDWQVEWWTYEDYKAWLEQEKKELQEIIGDKSWNPTEGWFTWDQKKVDETIALYESILEDIKNGALHSRTIIGKDGREIEDVALGSNGPITSFVETLTDDGLLVERENASFDAAALLKELKAFGITGDEKQMYYNGQLIRRFADGASVGDGGYSIQYVYANDQGTVDIHTLRSVIRHPDGSYDVMGDLIGVAAAGDENFDSELIGAASFDRGAQATAAGVVGKDEVQPQGTAQTAIAEGTGGHGTSFEEIFAKYADYGPTYRPRETGMGALDWNGQPVRSFADLRPDGGVFSYQDSYAEDGLRLRTEYGPDGALTGLRPDTGEL